MSLLFYNRQMVSWDVGDSGAFPYYIWGDLNPHFLPSRRIWSQTGRKILWEKVGGESQPVLEVIYIYINMTLVRPAAAQNQEHYSWASLCWEVNDKDLKCCWQTNVLKWVAHHHVLCSLAAATKELVMIYGPVLLQENVRGTIAFCGLENAAGQFGKLVWVLCLWWENSFWITTVCSLNGCLDDCLWRLRLPWMYPEMQD